MYKAVDMFDDPDAAARLLRAADADAELLGPTFGAPLGSVV
ncbi:hypothetical protein [Embleya sp. MST-111070]